MFDLGSIFVSIKVKQNELTGALDQVQGKLSKVGGWVAGAGKVVATGFAAMGAGAVALGGMALKSAADFESMNVALITAMGGNKQAAAEAMAQITQFASKTPYDLNQVMGAFIKLKNMGLNPSQEAMTSYGDTASAMGKSLNDMIEAVADAATGEFERLKEFGIRSSVEGDRVKFTFKGVTTEVGKNSKEIEDYLIKLGQTNFSGGMDAQSKTLSGTIATLKDTFSLALNQIAQDSGLMDIAKQAVDALSAAVPIVTKWILEAIKVFKEQWLPVLIQWGLYIQNNIIPILIGLWAFIQNNVIPIFKLIGDVIRFVIWPALQLLWNAISNDLWPALKRLWDLISPVLIPVLKFLAVVLGGVLVGAILAAVAVLWGIIQVVTIFANHVSNRIEQVKAGIEVVKQAFGSMRGAINSALAGIDQAIIQPFKKALDWVKGAVDGAVNKLKDLNPFQRHSPSLFDLVSKGTEAITDKYAGMYRKLSDMAGGVNASSFASTTAPATNIGGIAISMAGANISSRQVAEEYAEAIGDKIMQKLQKNARF